MRNTPDWIELHYREAVHEGHKANALAKRCGEPHGRNPTCTLPTVHGCVCHLHPARMPRVENTTRTATQGEDRNAQRSAYARTTHARATQRTYAEGQRGGRCSDASENPHSGLSSSATDRPSTVVRKRRIVPHPPIPQAGSHSCSTVFVNTVVSVFLQPDHWHKRTFLLSSRLCQVVCQSTTITPHPPKGTWVSFCLWTTFRLYHGGQCRHTPDSYRDQNRHDRKRV